MAQHTPWYRKYFENKRIVVMGLGLLGRGLGDSIFLAEQGAHLLVTDLKQKDALQPALNKLAKYPNIEYVLGKHQKKDFKKGDVLLHAAGVPLGNEYVEIAHKAGLDVQMSASWLVDILKREGMDVTVIGVTGSKGKSTTTSMIECILKEAQVSYHVGGNVRGLANLPLLKKIKPGDVLLLELDSWQLQGFGRAHISPDIAVFTNFFPDHMNYYGGSMKKYFKDKANIFRYQKEPRCVVSRQAKEAIREYGRPSDLEHIRTITKAQLPDEKYRVLGEHNRENLALAYKVGLYLDIPEKTVVKALKACPPVEGRLEYMGVRDGVHFYNDNNSTTPESTLLSLETISKHHNKKVIWWGGGASKDADYVSLAHKAHEYTKQAILFDGEATQIIMGDLQDLTGATVGSIKEAIGLLAHTAKKEDVVVFSPGASSFGMFTNEYERNDHVVRAITKFTRV